MNFHPVGLESKNCSYRGFTAFLFRLRPGLVGFAIRINDEMDRRAIDLKKVEAKPGVDKGEDFDPRIKPVDVRVRLFASGLKPMDRQAICFHREMEHIPVNRPQFHPCPR